MNQSGENLDSANGSTPDLASNSADLVAGQLFDTRYEVVSLVGAGATGTIYKARDTLLQRIVAIKIIHKHLLLSPKSVERFKKEAHTCTRLSHPNIGKVYSSGVAPDGRLYMIMDCLEGESLGQVIAHKGKLEFGEFFIVFSQLIDALEYAHSQGLVHRDIKPTNIFVVEDEGQKKAILLDFGLAKWLDETQSQKITQTTALLGSSSYMSPEQCRASRVIDLRSDIYSLGCVMFESLLGKPPFSAETSLDVMYKHLHESLSDLGSIKRLPDSIARMILTCLQKDPSKRFQSMQELHKAFSHSCSISETGERSAGSSVQRANKPLVVGISMILLAIAALGIWSKNSSQVVSLKKSDNKISQVKVTLDKRDYAGIPFKDEFLDKYIARKTRDVHDQLKLLKGWETRFADEPEGEEADSNRALVYKRFVEILIPMKRLDEATHYAHKVLKLHVESCSANVAIELSLADIAHDSAEDGLAISDRFLRHYPTGHGSELLHNQVSYCKARCLAALGKEEESFRILEQIHESLWRQRESDKSVVTTDATCAYFEALLHRGHIAEAKKLAAVIHDFSSSDTENLFANASACKNIGIALMRQSDSDSISFMALASKLFSRLKNTREQAKCVQLCALYSSKIKDYKGALRYYDEANRLSNDLTEKLENLISMSDICFKMGEIEKGLQWSKKAQIICLNRLEKAKEDQFYVNDEIHKFDCVRRIRNQLNEQHHFSEAESLITECINLAKRRTGDTPLLAEFYQMQAEQQQFRERLDQAILFSDKSIRILSNKTVEAHSQTFDSPVNQALANAYLAQCAFLEIASRWSESAELAKKASLIKAQKPYTQVNSYVLLGNALTHLNKTVEAKEAFAQAETSYDRFYPKWTSDTGQLLGQVAVDELSSGLYADSERHYKKCLDSMRKTGVLDAVPIYLRSMGQAMRLQNKFREAEAALLESERLLEKRGVHKGDDVYLGVEELLLEIYNRKSDFVNAKKCAEKQLKYGAPLHPS